MARLGLEPRWHVVHHVTKGKELVGELGHELGIRGSTGWQHSDVHPNLPNRADGDVGDKLAVLHTNQCRTRQDGYMAFEIPDMWTDLDPEFANEVRAARRRHQHLVGATEAVLVAWVEGHCPSNLLTLAPDQTPTAMSSGQVKVFTRLDYPFVVHNRNLSTPKLVSVVAALLTTHDPDDLAKADLLDTSDPTWVGALRANGAPSAATRCRWIVTEGNHRVVAQLVLGIGPFAMVRKASDWR
jgi:hypothetical protein